MLSNIEFHYTYIYITIHKIGEMKLMNQKRHEWQLDMNLMTVTNVIVRIKKSSSEEKRKWWSLFNNENNN